MSFEHAKQHFIDGLAHLEAGRLPQAEAAFLASLALLPGRVSTLVNLAATRLRLGRPQEALAAADEVLAQDPHDLDARLHRATALAQLGRAPEALQAYDVVLAGAPDLALAWSHRGGLLRELGRLDEAAASFREAVKHGADPALHAYYLAAVGGGDAPSTAPEGYVQRLFDDYAGHFDEHLVQVLRYRAPAALARHVAAMDRRFAAALDLGCGTGLCAPPLRPMVDRLDGVDLSPAMLDQARALGLYDGLVRADVVEFLQRTGRRYDLVVAADVFIYVGDLEPVFAGVARAMPAGGVFCFSAERGEAGFELTPSLRYAHAPDYLRGLAARHGFVVDAMWEDAIREDQAKAVPGLYVGLTRA